MERQPFDDYEPELFPRTRRFGGAIIHAIEYFFPRDSSYDDPLATPLIED